MNLPSEENSIFVSSNKENQSAVISSPFFNGRKYFEYSAAYKEAGDRLVSAALEDQSLFMAISIYPIVFLYRQFIELYIKDLLLKHSTNFINDKSLRRSHDIYNLWKSLLEIIQQKRLSYPNVFTTDNVINALIGADAYLAELSIVDRESMAFRYPDDKTHKKDYFPNEITIDLCNLKERINELSNLFVFIEKRLDETDPK